MHRIGMCDVGVSHSKAVYPNYLLRNLCKMGLASATPSALSSLQHFIAAFTFSIVHTISNRRLYQ